MVDVRFLKQAVGQFPLSIEHLATVSYVDSTVEAAAALSNDRLMYGDVLSSATRREAADAAGMDNGYYTISGIVAPKTFTATKIRFAVVAAGTVTGTPAVALTLYGGAGSSQNQVATAPITGAMLTTTGVKELTLSAPLVVAGNSRYTPLFYIPPSAFSARPSFASVANARSVLANPSTAYTFDAYKAASAAPPASINTSDGSWSPGTTLATVLWWALL